MAACKAAISLAVTAASASLAAAPVSAAYCKCPVAVCCWMMQYHISPAQGGKGLKMANRQNRLGRCRPQTPSDVPHPPKIVGLLLPRTKYEGEWGSNVIIVCPRHDFPNQIRCLYSLPHIRRINLRQIRRVRPGPRKNKLAGRSGGRAVAVPSSPLITLGKAWTRARLSPQKLLCS